MNSIFLNLKLLINISQTYSKRLHTEKIPEKTFETFLGGTPGQFSDGMAKKIFKTGIGQVNTDQMNIQELLEETLKSL